MSVINKMLKDLEQRQQPHDLSNISHAQVTQAEDNFWKKAMVILLSLLIILVAAASGYWLYLSETPNTELQTSTQQTNVQTPIKPQPVAAQSIEKEKQKQQVSASAKMASVQISTAPPEKAAANRKIQDKQQSSQSVSEVAKVESKVKPPAPKPIIPTAKPAPKLQIKEIKLSPKQLAVKFYKQALQAQNDGELNSAIDMFLKVLELNPAQHQAREKLAALLYGKQSYSEAIQLLNDGISRYPKYSMYALLLAKIQYQLKQPQQALLSLEKIPNHSPLALRKWAQVGRITQQQKQYTRAAEAYKQLTHIEPNQSRWWLGLAFNLDSQAQYTAASNAYKQALLSSNLSPASEKYVQQRLQQLAAHSLASKKDGSAQ